jgi:sensor histidine kinase YesM
MAQEVIDNFSQYLRHHIDTLSSLDMIPFSRELELVQNYVYLEKVRFGEDLKVDYDLQCQSFEIPPLTIQPLVENAIKHGVMKRPEGGTVTLRTEESSDHYIITVEDNGVGFSTKDNESRMTSPTRDHRSVGLRNVRYRLRAICQGDLTVESTPGVGTNVQILLPKS